MIKYWYVTGDCHGEMSRFIDGAFAQDKDPDEIGIIILGDFGVNFYLNKTDRRVKQKLQETGMHFFAVRGNHEQRPDLTENVKFEFNKEIGGPTWVDTVAPNITYLVDNQIYTFGGHTAVCVGGAYSVDKWYRLARAGLTGAESPELIAKKAGWFAAEQLTPQEMDWSKRVIEGKPVDFVFTHTCPLSWQPTDLFLGAVDQSKVDNTMEKWFDELKDCFPWKIWLFGHYHADRIERPHVEQYFKDVEALDTIWNRWYDEKTFRTEWWLQKAPAFYQKGDTPYDEDMMRET